MTTLAALIERALIGFLVLAAVCIPLGILLAWLERRARGARHD